MPSLTLENYVKKRIVNKGSYYFIKKYATYLIQIPNELYLADPMYYNENDDFLTEDKALHFTKTDNIEYALLSLWNDKTSKNNCCEIILATNPFTFYCEFVGDYIDIISQIDINECPDTKELKVTNDAFELLIDSNAVSLPISTRLTFEAKKYYGIYEQYKANDLVITIESADKSLDFNKFKNKILPLFTVIKRLTKADEVEFNENPLLFIHSELRL